MAEAPRREEATHTGGEARAKEDDDVVVVGGERAYSSRDANGAEEQHGGFDADFFLRARAEQFANLFTASVSRRDFAG